MQNNKPFPRPVWVEAEFLSPPQREICRTLFRGQDSSCGLTVIDLRAIETELCPPVQAFVATYLDPIEQETYATFSFAKRRLEWFGGRIAAKMAAMAVMAGGTKRPPSFLDIRVETEATGRPSLRGKTTEGVNLPHISISHSHGLAGAIATQGRSCGLDLQQITPKVLTVRDRFMTRDEWAIIHANPSLRGQDEATLLTLLWAAKESVRKAIACQPLLGFTEITLCRLEGELALGLSGHFTSPRLASPPAPFFLVKRGGFACAMTVQDPAALPLRSENLSATALSKSSSLAVIPACF